MVLLDGTSLTLDALDRIAHRGEPVGLTPDAAERVRAARAVVDAHAARGTPVYGVNTGFGALAEVARLPGAEAGDRWIAAARRYTEARRALDGIETAAILGQGRDPAMRQSVVAPAPAPVAEAPAAVTP